MQVQDAGSYTITTGIWHGREHIFVTHRETGEQWVSKTPEEEQSRNIDLLATLIANHTIKFHPGKLISCDTRFWEPVRKPVAMPRSEFDALTFVGD